MSRHHPLSLHRLLFLLLLTHHSSSQTICPPCGPIKIPYPLSTSRNCGNPDYTLFCDHSKQQLFFNALNGSSYLVLKIQPSTQKIVVKPSPFLPRKCITRDMLQSNGVWLNQTLPFNLTSSNTIFLFNCSPRLLVSPLNCTATSLCHRYLRDSSRLDPNRAAQCADGSFLSPCCTFIAGGLPSAYKIRLHTSGCQAYTSILRLNTEKPANEWEEGLEIQWASPPEPTCETQFDCSKISTCSVSGNASSRCLCNKGYYWNPVLAECSKSNHSNLGRKAVGIGALATIIFMAALVAATAKFFYLCKFCKQAELAKSREETLKAINGGKSAKMFGLKEVRKATDGFSRERILGSGGFGEVYKGVLEDGTVVAVKSAKVGNLKSTQQVLNEVSILTQVNHKNLVKLLGCCVESEQPLMIYEYIPNGTLYDHLHEKYGLFLDWKTRLNIALHTAEALAYLHSSAQTPIYHRDVKSTNILLDEKLNAKVADFGLSRLAQPGLSHVSTCAQGTLGYLDPEYYRNYQLTDKSDVYSYGVVLLELLTSQKAIDFSREPDDVNLAVFVIQRSEKGSIMDVVDRRLLSSDDNPVMDGIRHFSELALACLHERKGDRPSMKEVVQVLVCIIEMLEDGENL